MKIAQPASPRTDHSRFTIENGTMAHYQKLSQHHYKAGRPATGTTVFVMHDQEATDVVARFRNVKPIRTADRANITTGPQPIGVLVRSYPRLCCQLRDLATARRYTRLDPRARAKLLNTEIRVISRVVIDPRYRGFGLAVRLVKHALSHPETIYTEALAAMGRVNPFFEKAGMTRYAAPPLPEHARFIAALEELHLPPCLLASPKGLAEKLAAATAANRAWFEFELRRWAALAFRQPRQIKSTITYVECLALARDHLLARSVYYLHRRTPTK